MEGKYYEESRVVEGTGLGGLEGRGIYFWVTRGEMFFLELGRGAFFFFFVSVCLVYLARVVLFLVFVVF